MSDLAELSDEELAAIWLNAPDPERPTPREEEALRLCEERGVDF